MGPLNPDVLYALLSGVQHPDILALSTVSRALRAACLPFLFHDVRWPHPDKIDPDGALDFFPPGLWGFFRRFHLLWPDHWADASPPAWGDIYFDGGDYHPRHMDTLIRALPLMSSLLTITIHCPFFPSRDFFKSLIRCKVLEEIVVDETLLYITNMTPDTAPLFTLKRVAFVRVAEALRIGEGPYDPKYRELAYYNREYRRRYKNDPLARSAAYELLFRIGSPTTLTYVQLSGDLLSLSDLAEHEWPCLVTLVLTGHTPRPGKTELVNVIAHMPALEDLRLLFARTKTDPAFRVIPSPSSRSSPTVLSQLKSLALSNACNLLSVFTHTTALERVCIPAIIDHPRVPIGLSRGALQGILEDMRNGEAGGRVRQFRVMLEDKVNPDLCALIAATCPALEMLEVELCGYHDGKSVYAWQEFTDALTPLSLTHLRLCIQFPEYDETDKGEPWRAARRECAYFLAERLGLQRVGVEYRKRTGTHRYEDSWLEFDVRRGGEGVELVEVEEMWYPFPEVWVPSAVGRSV